MKNIIINFYELFFSAFLKKGIYETIHQNVFQLINQIYLWVFIFRVAEKGYNTMQLYIYLLIRTCNPDNRTFGPRASVLVLRSSQIPPYIYGGRGSVSRNEWGIELLPYRGFSASCDFQKGVCHTINKKILQVINQNIYGFLFSELQRKGFL